MQRPRSNEQTAGSVTFNYGYQRKLFVSFFFPFFSSFSFCERRREKNGSEIERKKQADGRLKVRAFLVTDAKSTKSKLASTRHITRGSGSSKIVHIYIYVSAGLMCVCVCTILSCFGGASVCRAVRKTDRIFPPEIHTTTTTTTKTTTLLLLHRY